MSAEPTPMMKQYFDAKEASEGALLLFRMGDFYELFYEDAYKAGETLGITVTTRDRNKSASEAVPMAGFPWHHLDAYLARLVAAGHRVAVCDQMEDPKKTKSLVKREVTRIVTPGTMMDESMLDPRQSNYLAAIYVSEERESKKASRLARRAGTRGAVKEILDDDEAVTGDRSVSELFETTIPADRYVGLAWVELSTGHFCASTVTFGELFDQLARISPAECLIQEEMRPYFPDWLLERAALTPRQGWIFSKQTALDTLAKHFKLQTFEGFGFDENSDDVFALQAAGCALEYLLETQKQSLEFIDTLAPYRYGKYLEIDESTRRSLEIAQTYRDGRREGSFLATIDQCSTPMGSRLLAEWVAYPLTDSSSIVARQNAIEEILTRAAESDAIRELFRDVSDLERIVSRIVQERGTPRELVSIAKTLQLLPQFKAFLDSSSCSLLKRLGERLTLQDELCDELTRAFGDEAPLNYRDGGFVQDGYSEKLDEYRRLQRGSKEWLAAYQAREVERTGVPNLRVGFTSVFGYYIEITRSQIDKVPDDYTRKQTLKNVERYITPELKDYEEKALAAQELALEQEMEIFAHLQRSVAKVRADIQRAASVLAHLDVLAGLAALASTRNYCRPTIVEEPVLSIIEGRHPSLDANCSDGEFVPNDSVCNADEGYVHLITGPNMSGKSTFIRQTALLVLMAQIGSYIPASKATIGLADRIFARVGASDELTRGQSTFMVEMVETARILNNATPKSLVILDEIGRGTSTYDGISLAWAIVEYISSKLKCRTFFATHYHELTDLDSVCEGVNNLNVAVREWRDDIAFLHKIMPGAADKSYGIHVARLAGVPKEVVDRAKEILVGLEAAQVTAATDVTRKALRELSDKSKKKTDAPVQFSLFGPEDHPVVDELRKLDLDSLTPMDALLMIERWKTYLTTSEPPKR
ncbi:MAG: DNA mismatch repair protein MutS [Thermoguttaceae bacterium]|nr:DNA mismatch repair protein MutS [Thermoguttaceae bacterium]